MKQRGKLVDDLQIVSRQLARSASYSDLLGVAAALATRLADSSNSHRDNLERTIQRLCGCATILPLTAHTLIEALNVGRALDLTTVDALVLAAIEHHLRMNSADRKVFVNSDRGLVNGEVQQRLSKSGCKVLSDFASAQSYIDSQLARH